MGQILQHDVDGDGSGELDGFLGNDESDDEERDARGGPPDEIQRGHDGLGQLDMEQHQGHPQERRPDACRSKRRQHLCRDGQDGHSAAMAVVEPVDQMQMPRTAAPGADGQSSREVRFRAGSKRCGLLVPDMNPPHASLSAHRIRDSVERVA
jgi:hypothetical protein